MGDTPPTSDQQTRAHEAAMALRAVAHFVETHPEFEYAVRYTNLILPVPDAETFARLTRQLGGTRRKSAGETSFWVERDFGHDLTLTLSAPRDQVCERVQVGVREITNVTVRCCNPNCDDGTMTVGTNAAGAPAWCCDQCHSALPIHGPTIEVSNGTEPIYEWRCAPVLDNGEQRDVNRAGVAQARAALAEAG